MLKEETWTRTTISNYTSTNLSELKAIVGRAKDEGCVDEIKEICDEHITHSRDSIAALYISGILGLSRGEMDSSPLEALVDIFAKNLKDGIVESICDAILEEDAANKFALRTKIECIKKSKSGGEEIWGLYERLVNADEDEAAAAKIMAEHYKDDPEKSRDFYRKAIHRYISQKNFAEVEDIWKKLMKIDSDSLDYFKFLQRKIAQSINPTKSAILMQLLYQQCMSDKSKRWDDAIDLIKICLRIDPADKRARDDLATCYRKKYSAKANVESFIQDAGIRQYYRNVFDAISDFEKHIAFTEGNFVYHKTWKVGRIVEVKQADGSSPETLSVNFGRKNGTHDIALKMAVEALQPLSRNHIWVLKATKDPAKLKEKIKNDKAWALRTIITSFGNSCDLKKIKAELVGSLLDAKEWTQWNTQAKRILESAPRFGVNPDNSSEFVVRSRAVGKEEKLNNEFKAQKQFFPRVDTFMKFHEEFGAGSEFFIDMRDYFTGFLNSYAKNSYEEGVSEQVLASYLVVRRVYPDFLRQNAESISFEALFGKIEDPRKMYESLKDSKNTHLREDFLECVKGLPNWVDLYLSLFPVILDKKILQEIIDDGENGRERVQQFARGAFDDYRRFRDTIFFLFSECREDEWFKEIGIQPKKQLIALVNIVSQAYKSIDHKNNSTENKKIINNICKMLFEERGTKENHRDSIYAEFMMGGDEETMAHMYTLVDDIQNLDANYKAKLRGKILEKHPDYKFHASEEKAAAPSGMLVTKKMHDEKIALEEKMRTVDTHAIAKEVAEAKEKGDLKENAEYIAAKEAQHKLGMDLKRLQEEIARAVIFDPTTATASYVSFGTEVTLANNATGSDETYTILGPWESNPEGGVISYMSPFGTKLLDHKVGDNLKFEINEYKYDYTVKSIALAKF